jgi:ATP-dependent Clp protease ATP-binding subunit ClpC
MLLQIMEEGHLSDAKGKKVNFQNAIIIMTSNVGADMIKRQGSLGFNIKREEKVTEELAYEELRKKLTDALKRVFRPEFLNRLDGTIIFRPLTRDEIKQIVSLEVAKVAVRLAEHELKLELTPEASDKIAEIGYDPDLGARPLRRVVQNKIEDAVSDGVLSGQFQPGDTIKVVVRDDDVALAVEREEASEQAAPAAEAEAEAPA